MVIHGSYRVKNHYKMNFGLIWKRLRKVCCQSSSSSSLKPNQSFYNSQLEERKYPEEPMRTQSKKTTKMPKARENAGYQVVVGFFFFCNLSVEKEAQVFWNNQRAK